MFFLCVCACVGGKSLEALENYENYSPAIEASQENHWTPFFQHESHGPIFYCAEMEALGCPWYLEN